MPCSGSTSIWTTIERSNAQPPQAYKQPTKTDECAEWLVRTLADSDPLKPGEITKKAVGEGFSQRTVYRSREKLGELIVDTEGHKHPENRWAVA